MIDRTQAPPFKTLSKIEVIKASKGKLKNGIELYTINAGSQEIIRLELIFRAGMYYQNAALIASSTNSLLEMGTKTYSANQLSEGIDFYGSFIELGVGQDYAAVTVFSLNKYLKQTLKFVEEIVKYPTFVEDEFKILINNKRQKHLINSQKVGVLARRKFAQMLFGKNHPYGIDVEEKDFDRINRDEIRNFYSRHYHSKNCTMVASGHLPEDLTETLNEFFGNSEWGNVQDVSKPYVPLQTDRSGQFTEKEDAIQSAIKIGRPLFNKTNPDYFHFQVMNTILGGYFGSRLMANIREDKGYTYGIGSGLMSLVNAGYFYISTEVGADVTQKALDEIYKEIKIMREQLVPAEELETVRNYILGQFLRSVDGPFALADKFKAVWEFGLDYDYFDKYFKAVKTITPEQVREMAAKYLQEKDLLECVVGKK
jgi:predicted Zn-dependent peptidase